MGRQIGLYFEDPRTFVYFNWLKVELSKLNQELKRGKQKYFITVERAVRRVLTIDTLPIPGGLNQ